LPVAKAKYWGELFEQRWLHSGLISLGSGTSRNETDEDHTGVGKEKKGSNKGGGEKTTHKKKPLMCDQKNSHRLRVKAGRRVNPSASALQKYGRRGGDVIWGAFSQEGKKRTGRSRVRRSKGGQEEKKVRMRRESQ